MPESWSDRGDNWTFHAEQSGQPYSTWKQSVVNYLLEPYLAADMDVVEIAPGQGRWTEYLVGHTRSLVLVDVSESCMEVCRERFAGQREVSFVVNDGRSLPLEDGSADLVWSFAGFVHIEPEDTDAYLAEFHRILRPGGRFVVHHAGWWAAGDRAREPGASRSEMSASRFASLATERHFQIARQFRRWGDQLEFGLAFGDLITVGRKCPPTGHEEPSTEVSNRDSRGRGRGHEGGSAPRVSHTALVGRQQSVESV